MSNSVKKKNYWFKVCPFCLGEDLRIEQNITDAVIQCRGCKAQIVTDTLDECEKRWNRRDWESDDLIHCCTGENKEE